MTSNPPLWCKQQIEIANEIICQIVVAGFDEFGNERVCVCTCHYVRAAVCCMNGYVRAAVCCMNGYVRAAVCCMNGYVRAAACCMNGYVRAAVCMGIYVHL
jgi:hypothetical protein